MAQDITNVYEIWDLYEAAYYSLNGSNVECKLIGNKIVFSIEKGPFFERIRREYAGNTPVPALDYAHEIKMMRARMNSMRFEGQDLRR